MKELLVFFVLISAAFCSSTKAQNVTVTTTEPIDEGISREDMALDDQCRSLISKHGDATEMLAVCKKVVDHAEKSSTPQSHFLVRRGAYDLYAQALIQAKKPQDAVAVADKAVAIVSHGHDDASGSSAAYGIRGQAKAFAGDMNGADQDLEKAENYQRNGLNSSAGKDLRVEYSTTLKGLLRFHAQVLQAMGKQNAAGIKLEQAAAIERDLAR